MHNKTGDQAIQQLTRAMPTHPGIYIREAILPANVSVKKAAEMLGVSRPALSNLLNGKAALSPEMAMRFEKAFNAEGTKLLEMQARYDEFEARAREDDVAVRVYAPSYLQITAHQITAWSETIDARAQLPALLRVLIHSTGTSLTAVDFPAFDNSQRKGWDGQVKSGSATPWIPRGRSGWEFGCDKDARRKAQSDYRARTARVPLADRKAMTFVFVTPTNWPGKGQWATEKKELQEWKDVRAFDASDLEQWLEQSVPAQARFNEFQGNNNQDVSSLDQVWREWAGVTDPELSRELFCPASERHRSILEDWLQNPATQPLVVTADSSIEALAFLACALDQPQSSCASASDRAIVIRSLGAFRNIERASPNFVAIIASPEVERALAGLHKRTHTIIVRGRNTATGQADIALDLLGHEAFKNALTAMGLADDRIDQLARESARSPTILRRRLARVPAVKEPPWAVEHTVARKLIPFIFVGAWDSRVDADREILQSLTGGSYDKVEQAITDLLQMDDAPVWSIGSHRGVVSKIDALYAVHRSITLEDLENFLFAAELVLSEEDPALDLPEDKRWAANLYGKSRDHSAVLRQGLRDTLVLMAVQASSLMRERLGVNLEADVSTVVRRLLTPATESTWLSQRRDLPDYAEAAPDIFLSVLEDDLKSNTPHVAALLEPADAGVFGECLRTGLLWALELLAWKPGRLARVTRLIARLCTWDIDDNWANKPLATLESIFRSWMPQTAASLDQRNRTLERLTKTFPEVGWKICVDQFGPYSHTGTANYRPHWRTDAHDSGGVITRVEAWQAQQKAINLVLNWPAHDEHTLGDLVQRLGAISPAHRSRAWDLISAWNERGPTDDQKAYLREKIRLCALTRRSRRRGLDDALVDCARRAYELLKPDDPVFRNRWLFLRQWVDDSADELEEDDPDYREREERIARQRREALREVWNQLGLEGIKALCRSGEASGVIGWHLAEITTERKAGVDLLNELLLVQEDGLQEKLKICVTEFLQKLHRTERSSILWDVLDRQSNNDDLRVRLLTYAPFLSSTWEYLDSLPKPLRARYWSEVQPTWEPHEPSELTRLVDELLKAKRPRAAFHATHMELKRLGTAQLKRLLIEMATSFHEPPGQYRFDPYYVSEGLDILEERRDVPRADLARLEFMYIDALDHTQHGIRNLEAELSETPELFMQALVLVFKRSDDGEDSPKWRLPNPDQQAAIASAAHSLLTNASRTPGTRGDGGIDGQELLRWLNNVRSLCRECARVDVGDQMIGQLLSRSAVGDDGVWPCEPVREAIEEIGSNEIARGMEVGVYNSRGVISRGEGGAQERELAEKYRKWSSQLAFDYPFTARMLDMIARGYDYDAERWDREAGLRQRVGI